MKFSMSKNTPGDTHKTRKPLFPQLETQKIHFEKSIFLDFFGKDVEKGASTTISQAEVSYESERVPNESLGKKDAQSRKKA